MANFSKPPEGTDGDLAYADLVIACCNIGYDLTCGACAATFYTGSIGAPGCPPDEHDEGCKTRRPRLRRLVAEWRGCADAADRAPGIIRVQEAAALIYRHCADMLEKVLRGDGQ